MSYIKPLHLKKKKLIFELIVKIRIFHAKQTSTFKISLSLSSCQTWKPLIEQKNQYEFLFLWFSFN